MTRYLVKGMYLTKNWPYDYMDDNEYDQPDEEVQSFSFEASGDKEAYVRFFGRIFSGETLEWQDDLSQLLEVVCSTYYDVVMEEEDGAFNDACSLIIELDEDTVVDLCDILAEFMEELDAHDFYPVSLTASNGRQLWPLEESY